MEPNRLEKQIREKLKTREIKPREVAWDRLDAMLSVAESDNNTVTTTKSKRKLNSWLVAASIAGFLLISTIFFNQNEKVITPQSNDAVAVKTRPATNTANVLEATTKKIVAPETQHSIASKTVIPAEKTNTIQAEKQEMKPAETIVVAVQNQIVQEDIDNLIATAEKNQLAHKKNPSIKVNPSDLLNQVDGELQVSFRERAFNTITKKYKEAREAVANRNNQ